MTSQPLACKGESRFFPGLCVVCLAVFMTMTATPAWTQSTATGTVSGQVTDSTNAVIAGVQIKLVDTATKDTLSTTTNGAGRYVYLNVPPGTYNLSFNKPGFSIYDANSQKVDVGQVLTISPVLTVGATTTTVEVTSVAGAELQTANATVGTTITGPSLILLPNIGRDASTFAIFQPGVTPGGSVAGAMYDQNTFQLDGGNNSNDMDGSMLDYTGSYSRSAFAGMGGSGSAGPPSGVLPTP